jgi:hypothetical protein
VEYLKSRCIWAKEGLVAISQRSLKKALVITGLVCMFAYSFCSQARITYILRKLATNECIDDETYGVQKMKLSQCISHCAKYTLTLGIAYTEHGVLIFLHLHLT